jgi:hypothetical protein
MGEVHPNDPFLVNYSSIEKLMNLNHVEKVKKKVLTVNGIHYIMCIVSNESSSIN